MKILFFADLHARKLYRNLKTEGVLRDVLVTIEEIAEIASSNSVSKVIFLGDMFHKIGTISVELLARVFPAISEIVAYGGDLIFLVGNHDISGNYTSLETFNGIGTVIDTPTMLTMGGLEFFCYPYTKGTYIWEKADVFLGHLGFAEGELDASDMKLKDEISVSDLKDFYQLGICGHYHKQQEVASGFYYVGSPLQLSFGEVGQEKYCLILDTENLELEWIELKKARKYKAFDITSKEDFPPEEDLADSIIRFRVEDKLDTRWLLERVPKESEYVIEKVVTDKPAQVRLDPEMGIDDLIAKYLAMVDTPYKKSSLTRVAQLIMAKG